MAQAQRKGGAAGGGGRGFYWLLALVAVIGVGTLIWVARSGGSAATAPIELGSVEEAERVAQRAEPVRRGEPGAPVQIVEFADYQCPACAHFALNVLKPLESYIEGGQAQLVFYDFPLSSHPNAFLAARAAHCARDQERFWDYQDMLFGRQSDWGSSRSPADVLTAYAEQLGLDVDAFENCLRSDRYAELVTANALVGERLGVRGTPTVYINGRSVGNAWNDADAMRRLVEQALGGGATQ